MEKPMSEGIGVLPDPTHSAELKKALTGIQGLDQVTLGGLPKGRPTLVCGGPGSDKTLLAMTCLVNGAVQFDEAIIDIGLPRMNGYQVAKRIRDCRTAATRCCSRSAGRAPRAMRSARWSMGSIITL
jgi:CheY-like chemotaxis protein